jgi:hypothetical protein
MVSIRLANQHLEFAEKNFPSWNDAAKAMLRSLNEQHKQKALGPKSRENFLVTYLSKLYEASVKEQPSQEKPSQASEKPSPSRPTRKPASPKTKGKGKGRNNNNADGAQEDGAEDKSPEPEPSVQQLSSSVVQRAQEDDAHSSDEKSAGVRDEDILMEGGADDAELNVRAVQEAVERVRNPKRKHPAPAPKRAAERAADSDDDVAAKTKQRRQSSVSRKPRKSRDSDTVEISDDEDIVKDKVGRYKRQNRSAILVNWKPQIELIRPVFQAMMLSRDGADQKLLSTHREGNLALIYSAAKIALSAHDYKAFREDCEQARSDPSDQ